MTVYPIAIDSSLNLPEAVDAVTAVNAQTINALRTTIIAIETELGVKPSNTYGTVRARLDALETALQIIISQPVGGGITPGGDLSGNSTSQLVVGLQGRPVSPALPTSGQVIAWDSSINAWKPTNTISPVKSVQNGFNYAPYFDVMVFPNEPSTNQNVFVNGGSFQLNPNDFTVANGTRTIKMKIIAETTGPVMTIQLYNLTTNSIVPGTILSTSSITAQQLMTSDLTSVLYNGTAVYQVQIKMGIGGTTDRVTLVYAVMHIEWS